jgi:hypothetical protein
MVDAKQYIKQQKARYTIHAHRDYFLGGYTAVLKRDGRVVYRSNNSFRGRPAALRAARYKLCLKFARN